jgi:RimJ/RimL family protein N-acetyltransferase
MRPMSIMLRHFAEADVPIRCDLLRDSGYQANLNDLAVGAHGDTVAEIELRTIRSEQQTRRIFTICTPDGTVMGFGWLGSIDWPNQCCELSFAMLPKYRHGFGVPAIAAVRDYLHSELNLQIVVNQVLSHNTMLQSADNLAAYRQAVCEYDSYTVGQWRTACFWTNSEQEMRAERETRRRERSARIRAAVESAVGSSIGSSVGSAAS